MRPRDVIILLPDCLRAAETDLMSNVNQWADIALPECYSSGTWTLPAHATLYSTEPGYRHQTIRRGDTLTESDAVVPQTARDHGYVTTLVSENPTFGTGNGFGANIDVIDEDIHLKRFATNYSPASNISEVSPQAALTVFRDILDSNSILKNIINTLNAFYEQQRSPPVTEFPHHGERVLSHLSEHIMEYESVFAVTNLLDTHNPHYCPPDTRQNKIDLEISQDEIKALKAVSDNREYVFNQPLPNQTQEYFDSWDAVQSQMQKIYQTQIIHTDRIISEWVDRHRDRITESLVVVVGDHGQMFGAEGMVGHQTSLHPHGVAIPTFVSFPENWTTDRTDISTPVSLTGLSEAICQTLAGEITCGDDFLSVWTDSDVIVCVDGPTWRINELRDTYGESHPVVDELAVRKIGIVNSNHRQTVHTCAWDSTTIETETYRITSTGRQRVDAVPVKLTDSQRQWLRNNKLQQELDQVSDRLEALGYK